MEKPARSAAALASLILFLSCAKADVLVLEPTPHPARLPDSVAVFLEEPTRPYRAIALVEVSDQSWGLSLETLAKRMRLEAGKLGGDAVIIGSQSTESGAVIVPIGNMWYAGATKEKKLVGKVIIFTPVHP